MVIKYFKFAGYLRIKVESQGFLDKKRGRILYGRSRAYIRVNGRDYSQHKRAVKQVSHLLLTIIHKDFWPGL